MNARRHLVGAGEQRRIVGPDWRAIWFGKRVAVIVANGVAANAAKAALNP
jgi:hypothetical protein